MTRKSTGKKARFEVFKRDNFTCQYCGRAAPDVVLHVDHIKPVSKGGENDITNLITSCADCNGGKSNRELDDDAVIQKRKKQLDELQERREQLEMMVEWQRGLIGLESETVSKCAEFWKELVPGYYLNEHGLENLKKTLRRFGAAEVLEVMRVSVDQYVKWEKSADDEGVDKPTSESVQKAFTMIERICVARKRQKDKPWMKDLYYIRGIIRNRMYCNEWQCMELLESAHEHGICNEELKEIATTAKNWTCWKQEMEELIGDLIEIEQQGANNGN